MKKMLICGANGFIGRNALEFFKQDYDITAVLFSSHNPDYGKIAGVKYIKADLRIEQEVKDIFEEQQYDVVIQAAATTTGAKDVVERPYLHVTDNVVMNAWLFREAVLNRVGHVLFPSCTVMYQPKDSPQSEEDWDAGEEIYSSYFGVGNMKVFTERMCDFYSRIGQTKFTAFRHSNVYGPYDKFDLDKCHVIPAFINKIANAKDTLEIWGSGKAARDVVYIDDLITFIDVCIQNQTTKYELFNCGVGKAFSIMDLATTIMKVGDKNLNIEFDITKPDIPTTVILNCNKAFQQLGWKPNVSLSKGLAITYQWYCEHRHALQT